MATYFPRFFKPPGQSFFLFGPRGTGKTTFLRHHFPDALWIDLLRPEVHRRYLARPERLRELTDARPGQLTVVIDEVQKAPNLLPVVHGLIEERQVGKEEQKLRFVLTGSSARKLKKTGVNLLAGRALYKTFHPFLFSELPFAYPMEKALRFGMLPLVLQAPEPEQTLDAYVSLYIREEVQYEG
ncbi:MAG TPA: ATP-binding protein, partial [Phaeodactylibacter sp.]|nr:ATP-binding protein [Phaeodactylibacter sp.]